MLCYFILSLGKLIVEFRYKSLWITISSALASMQVIAQEKDLVQDQIKQLPVIVVEAHPLSVDQNDYANAINVVDKEKLRQGATTLGDALNGELSIHNDNFGGGASRPVIRGQTSPRVKVLSDSSEVMDVSQISPDHEVTVDPLLASKVEVLRGPSTLLYGGGAIGGVVNVLDEKIPSQMPENGISGEVHLRGNTVANEKSGAAGLTIGLGERFALRLEGDKREADNYQINKYIDDGIPSKRVDGTWTKAENIGLGMSWIGEDGYIGLAYSERKSQYGLAGDSEESEECQVGVENCNEPNNEERPWINLESKRFDFRSEYLQPFIGIDKVKARASYTDYQHSEIEGGEIGVTFKNRGYDGRLEFVHSPVANWKGVVGVQYAKSNFDVLGDEAFLPKTSTENLAAFLIENYQWSDDLRLELGTRIEQQKINVENSQYQDFNANAFSASGAINWDFLSNHILSLSLSYAERLPNAQELYAEGPHLATNTFEIGNDSLEKEKSQNIELGIRKVKGNLNYEINTFYNQFKDYIYANTLGYQDGLRTIEYTQADANFYGAEAEVSYQFSPLYRGKIFADHVRAELDRGGNLPRIPSTRTGIRFDANFLDGIHGGVEYIYGLKQDRIADFESETGSYKLINMDISYDYNLNKQISYQVYLRGNNLLNETYYNHSSYLSTIPQQGRNFTAGIRFNF